MGRIIGCKNLHIAAVTKDDSEGATYDTPTPVPALVSIDIKDNSDSVVFYSDDVAEQTINTFANKEVTIELGYLSPELEAKITGQKYANGVFSQEATPASKEFALLFKAELSTGGYQYVCLYKGVLNRSETTYKTKEESVEGQTVTLTGTFSPLIYNGRVFAKANDGDTGNTTIISKWFTAVPVDLTASGVSELSAKKVKQ